MKTYILNKNVASRITRAKDAVITLLLLCVLSFSLSIIGESCIGVPTATGAGQGTLNLYEVGPYTLDPALTADSGSGLYIYQIFSGLVRLDEKLEVVPDIAASWDKSTDGKTYTFHLRPDVKFQDGKQVTAADFKYAWERALAPATMSPTAGIYLNDIVGVADIQAGRTASLAGVTVIDNGTLQVAINTPVPYFLEKMAFPTSFVVDKANVQSGSNWTLHPNGTGPFKLRQWQPDQLVVLQRNDLYYGEKAKVNEVDFQLLAGNSIDLYQQGKIDVAGVSSAYMGLVTDPTNPVSRELQIYPDLSLYYIGFDASRPPFDDANVRRAFSYAIDKARIIALALDNTAPIANGILPPGMPGYNANLAGLTYDPQKARDLLAASRYPDLSTVGPIVATTAGWGNNISGVLGGLIAEWQQNLGVDVSVRQLEQQDFLYSLNVEKDNLFEQGWIADYPDPQDFLEILFRTGVYYNTGEYSNPQLDSLLSQAAIEQDAATRLKMYQEAEQIVVQDAAVLPISFGRSYYLVKPYVKNYSRSLLGYPFLNQVSIQK